MKVEDAMNKAMVIDENVSLKQAAKIMEDKKIGCLVVMKKDRITGILTEGDVARNTGKLAGKVSVVMSKEVVSVGQKEDLNHAARLMAENKIKRLPVLDKAELVGILTASDILENSDALEDDFLIE